MNRSRWLIALALPILFGTANRAMAAKSLSIEKMEQLLATLDGKPDGGQNLTLALRGPRFPDKSRHRMSGQKRAIAAPA
jgi:hypothetical protein